jgi:basic amino acid/polyamine antiporter, APA family
LTECAQGLVRSIGRWSLAALMVNTILGASMLAVPSLIAARLGRLSPIVILVAFAGISVIAACMAEVASQFQDTGGPYLYARAAFGRFLAIQNGWLMWLTRIAAVSAVANLFVIYLSNFFPGVRAPLARGGVLALLIGFLAAVNYCGVTGGKLVSNLLTITKLTIISFFIVAGFAALWLHPGMRLTPEVAPATAGDWFEAMLLMMYSYGGFEAALIVAGETRDTRKDTPVALFIALAATTVVFVAVQSLVIHTVQEVGAASTLGMESARQLLGPLGVQIMVAGTLISAFGYLSANMLHTPRITFAMGERKDFPTFFGNVHPRFRTPHVSIVVFAIALLIFSIAGNFKWNAMLSSVARLFVYGSVAAALPALRKKYPQADRFHLPFGNLIAALALLFTGVLLTRMHRGELIVISITAFLAFLNWLWIRNRAATA